MSMKHTKCEPMQMYKKKAYICDITMVFGCFLFYYNPSAQNKVKPKKTMKN